MGGMGSGGTDRQGPTAAVRKELVEAGAL